MIPEFTIPCNADKSPRPKQWQRSAFQHMNWKKAELVGAPCGPDNGFDVLDIDPSGVAWYDANFDALPQTYAHETPRGVHLFFRHSPGLRCSRSKIAPGVDIRTEGGFVIWWPREGYAVDDNPICDWPDWLIEEAGREKVGPGLKAYPRIKNKQELLLANSSVAVALQRIDPRDFRSKGRGGTGDYFEEWFALVGACKALGISREDFCDWSMGDPKYADDREKIERIWDSAYGDHPGAFYKALAERGIKLSSRIFNSRVRLTTPATTSSGHSVGSDLPASRPQATHWLSRVKGLRASLRRDQTEASLFSYSCLYAEILYEEDKASPNAFATAQKLLEEDCPKLLRESGIDAIRRCIRRGFDHIKCKEKRK
jgi:hypothetical protein